LGRVLLDPFLVGGFNHLEKNESQWEGYPIYYGKIRKMFQTTNQFWVPDL
jgi:hypothetical protein